MNDLIKKKTNLIVTIYLIMQPLFDVFTAVMLHYFNINFTIGVIVRFIFLIFVVYYLIFINKSRSKKKSLIYIGIIILYIILFSINNLYIKGIDATIFEIKELIKIIYFPIALVGVYNMYDSKDLNINAKLFRNLFVVYLLFVFIPNIFGIGFDSYAITKGGSVGWFYTANEIGAILSLLMPIYIYFIVEHKKKLLIFLSLVIVLYVLTSIGTKGPLLAFFIIILFYLIKYIIMFIKSEKYNYLGIIGSVIIVFTVALIMIIPKTTFYDNIVVHLNYLKVDSVEEIVNNPKVIDHFIFSQRLTFWKRTDKIYKDATISQKLLGIGYIKNHSTDEVSMKTVEMDYVDMFYRTGIIGFIIIMSSYIYFLYILIRQFFVKFKYNLQVPINQTYIMVLLLSIVLALFTGHVLTSPSVSIYVVLLSICFIMNL